MLPMARPRVHLLVSTALAWWTWRRWGPAGALAALVAGVLLDADHLVDYAFTGRGRRRTHYFAPLHGWEYPLTLALIALKGQASNAKGPVSDATSAQTDGEILIPTPPSGRHRWPAGRRRPLGERGRHPLARTRPRGQPWLRNGTPLARRRTRRSVPAWPAGAAAGLALGWALHLIIDVLSNRPRHPGVYLVLYRLAYAFRREATGWEDNRRFHSWAARPWWTWI